MINVKIWSLSNKFMLSHKGNNYFKKWVYRCLVHVTFITVYRNNEQVVYTHVPWLSPPRAWVGGEYNPLYSWQTPINTPLSNIKSPSLDQLVKIHTIQTSVGHRSPLEFRKSSKCICWFVHHPINILGRLSTCCYPSACSVSCRTTWYICM